MVLSSVSHELQLKISISHGTILIKYRPQKHHKRVHDHQKKSLILSLFCVEFVELNTCDQAHKKTSIRLARYSSRSCTSCHYDQNYHNFLTPPFFAACAHAKEDSLLSPPGYWANNISLNCSCWIKRITSTAQKFYINLFSKVESSLTPLPRISYVLHS